MDNLIESIEHRGHTINIYPDDMSGEDSPRDWNNLGTMVCFHRRYELGDKHDFSDPDELQTYIKINKALALPLFLLDHSGLWMNTRGFNYCDPGEWDSGQVGIIYVLPATVRKDYNAKRITKRVRESTYKVLLQEVETYNDYLTGNVYGYMIDGPACNDSCWGYYGDTGYMISQAKEQIDYSIQAARRAHFDKLKAWIKNQVPLYSRSPLTI